MLGYEERLLQRGFPFLPKILYCNILQYNAFFKWRESEGGEALTIRIILSEVDNFGAKQHDKIEVEKQRLIFDVG